MAPSQTLTIAAEIQQSLLPESYPRLSHFDLAAVSIPVDKVGGDFYDFIRLGEDRLGILMGDAMGHGLSAAILMAAAQSQLLSEARRALSPATVMTAAHRRVVDSFASQSQFTVASYGVLSQRNHRFTVTTAGMMPYWVRSEPAECLELLSPGETLPLGSRLMRGEYENREIVLSPGDVLVFYSDGLVEAKNRQEELFGYDRLADLLLSHRRETAFEIVNALITAMEDFADAIPLEDDLTLVVLKAAPPSDMPAVTERSTIQGERKPVAVMIGYVVEKSGEAVDAPKVISSVGDHLSAGPLLVELHDTYGGVFELLSKSTLVGLFGVPQTYEDNAQRALAAAWELMARLAEAGLSMRAGIHTGTVIFRPDAAIDYSLMGDTFNHALQLSHYAPEGGILLSEQAHQLTRGAFEAEATDILVTELGAVMQVKKPAVARSQPKQPALVGRTPELASLHQCLDNLAAGQGQIVSIIGEAGIGKSRLVAELKEYLVDRETDWLEGRCTSIGKSISYRPFLDILRIYFNLSEDDSEKEIALKVTEYVTDLYPQNAGDFLPFLGHLLSIRFGNELDDRLTFTTPEQIRNQAAMRLRDILTILGRRQPLLLILEDLHWSDDLSLDLLSLLMDELATTPLMLLCVYRPEKEHRISQLSIQAQRKCWDRYTEVRLQPLSGLQCRQLVGERLQIESLPEDIEEVILQKSEGNPFFIEEVIRSLREQDLLSSDGRDFEEDPFPTSVHVPDAIQSIVLARVDRLPSEVKHTLQYASVIGRLFKYRLLQHLIRPERHLDQSLDELEARELVYKERTVPEVEYAFGHGLTQEAIYQSLLEGARRKFHLEIAQGIEQIYEERLQEHYEELAYHYSKSDHAEKAVEYLLKAGQKAYRTYLNDEAIRYFRQALSLLESASADEFHRDWRQGVTTQLNEGLGDLLELAGQHDEAAVAYHNALDQIPKDNPVGESRLYRKTGHVWLSQRLYEKASQAYGVAETTVGQEAVESAPEWWREWVQIHLDRMWLHYRQNQIAEIAELEEKIYPAVERYGTPIQRAEFFQCLVSVHLKRERFVISEETLAYSQAALTAVQESGNLSEIAFAQFYLGFTYLWHGDFDEAEEHIQVALPMAEEVGDIMLRSRCLNYLTLLYRKLGRVEDVQRYALLSLDAALAARMPEYTGMTKGNLAWIAWRNGDLSETRKNGREALEEWKKLTTYETCSFKWTALWPLIGVALAQDRIPEAVDYIRGLIDPSQQRLPDALQEVLEKAIGAWEQAREETIRSYLNRAIEWAREAGYL